MKYQVHAWPLSGCKIGSVAKRFENTGLVLAEERELLISDSNVDI